MCPFKLYNDFLTNHFIQMYITSSIKGTYTKHLFIIEQRLQLHV